MRSDNAQNSYMNKFGIDDESYTKMVDNGTWKRPDTGDRFSTDKIGYGLAQWTSSGRKAGLYELCKSIGVSISNMAAQCEYAYREITRSKSLVEKLNKASSPEEAAVIIMTDYERPASKDDPTKQQIRASYAKDFYNKYFAEEEKPMSRKLRICIDPGHASDHYNRSPVVPAYYESAFTWKFAQFKKAEYERLGCEVVMTRSNINEDPSLYARGKMAQDCDLFESDHSNACNTESVDRPSIIIARDDGQADVVSCEALAKEIGQNIHIMMGTDQVAKIYSKDADYDRNKDGIKGNEEYYGVLFGAQQTNCPMYMIIEHSFHTNKKAATWLLSEANVKALAIKEAQITVAFLKKKYEITDKEPESVPVDYVEYVVKSGDRLSKIAAAYNVTVKDIQAINPKITDPNKISVGQTIRIPVNKKAEAEAKIAEIKAQINALQEELKRWEALL